MKNSGWGCGFILFVLFLGGLYVWSMAAQESGNKLTLTLAETNQTLAGTVDKLVDQNHELTDDIRAGARGQRWLNAFLIFVVVILVAVILVRETKRGNERNKA